MLSVGVFHGGFPHTHFPTYTSGCQAGLHWSPFLQNSTPFPTFFQTILKHFRHLTQLLSFAVSSPTLISDFLSFPGLVLKYISGHRVTRISVTMKCVSLQSIWIWMLYMCYIVGLPLVPIPQGLNISVGLMAVSSKAVEKACRPTGGLPSLSPLHHSTITKGGA